MKKLLIFFVLLVSHGAFAQHSHVAYLALADSLYNHQNYREAAVYYQQAIKNSKQPGNIMLKVARSYGEINNVKDAGLWYEKAKINNASFSNKDTYHYVKTLTMLEKREEAEGILNELLKGDPYDLYARQLLDDLRNIGKYYKDSSAYEVKSLSINTAVAEFAPAYYKDGIVFSSAQPQNISKKKYHWDNSHFLNLYYSVKITNHNFQKPVEFDKEINTRFHDGPVVFYANGERMILNRNQQRKVEGKIEVWMSHLSLFDVQRNTEKKIWEFTPLPFDQPPYSFAHPSVSEDGTILYFISDKPGGYGGTDIYSAIRTDGKWSIPFNLGPNINTSENEVFPFFINGTLYFASDGNGGLGGLDLFKSVQSVNGFSHPVNLGYPINSHADDLSLITTTDEQSGYFSSARSGNDDLFEFHKSPDVVKLLARIYDGVTKESLPDAKIQLITMTGDDLALTSGSGGNFQFELPMEAAYILIASKDGKIGMYSSLALTEEDYTHRVHQIPTYSDTNLIPCIGKIQNELGIAQKASAVNVIDETTGKKTAITKDQSMVSFLGEKGHKYRIEIENAQGDTVIEKLEIKEEDSGTKTWSIVLKETPPELTLAARVFNGDTKVPLAGASAKVITFAELDQDLTADENGIVAFSLPLGTAYIVVGSKDGLTGMNSGMVERGLDKDSVIHPVPAKGDPLNPVAVLGLVTNSKGEILHGAKVTITNKATGENIPGEIENGILNFFAERGKEYDISIEFAGYEPLLEEVSIAEDAMPTKKISVVLEESSAASYLMAVRVFKETDQSPLGGANVKIITFSEPDLELVANNQGVVEFTLPEGEGYVVAASKDGFTGMHMGVADTGMDKNSIIHPVPVNNDPNSTLQIFGMVRDESGNPITNAVLEVTDLQTGEKIPAKLEKGILSFYGKRGGNYRVRVSAEDYATQEKTIPIESTASINEPLVINLNKQLPVTAKVSNKKGELLPDAVVAVIDKTTGEKIPSEIKNGVLTFKGEQGKRYDITVEHNDYQTVVEELIIPQKATAVEELSFALVEKSTQPVTIPSDSASSVMNLNKQLPVTAKVSNEKGELLPDAVVTVTDKTTGEKIPSEIKNGVLTFKGEQGKSYDIAVEHKDYQTVVEALTIPQEAQGVDEFSISLGEKSTQPVTYLMAVRVFKQEDQSPLDGAQIKIMSFASSDIKVVANNDGVGEFTLPEGSVYTVVATKDGYSGMHSGIAEKGTDKSAVTHPVPTTNDADKQLPIVAFIADENDKPLVQAQVEVTDNITGQKVEAKLENGILSFYGKKGGDYKVVITSEEYETQVENVTIAPDATLVDPLEISLTRKKLLALPVGAKLIILNNETPRFYVTSDNAHDEIIEKDGTLYLQSKEETTSLGKGSLPELLKDPSSFFQLSPDQAITMQNIYFDFNSAELDQMDKQELDKAKKIMNRYPLLQLSVRAHADLRGSNTYNLGLTRKRARVIKSYLVKQGIRSRHIFTRAYGKSAPAIVCETEECSEQQHQKNRRAEFALTTLRKDKLETVPVVGPPPAIVMSKARKRLDPNYSKALEKYGARQRDGLVFKVCVGAYKLNPNLTFTELTDLGQVQKQLVGGINYYYLHDFSTLKIAEDMRQQVIQRGISDAYIVIFYEGKKISLSKFISVTEVD